MRTFSPPESVAALSATAVPLPPSPPPAPRKSRPVCAAAPFAPRNIRSASGLTWVAASGGTGEEAWPSTRPGIQ